MDTRHPLPLTTEAGAPVDDDARSQTAGPGGPVLLQDVYLLEKLARFNRERIPERVVHAVGSGAHGAFEVTNPDLPRWSRAALFAAPGKRTPLFLRFSTVAGSRGAADTVRDPRGFAVKFYTEEGNWDLVGNNTPIFFIRDGIKFPDFIHSQKPDPFTHRQEPDNVWGFFARTPEATHQFVWLFGDRGIPASLRHMDGFGSHTYAWVNAAGERSWVKFHFKTDLGIRCLTSEQAALIAGRDPTYHHKDLYDAITRGERPSWTLKVQVMPEADAAGYRVDPFDLTKVWRYEDYPLIEVGKLTLDRVPDNYFAATEQAAFSPGNFVPGIGPSPDRMLQARLFAYADAQRYRLGVNHTQLPINAPHQVEGGVRSHGRDGATRFDDNGGRDRNHPSAFGGLEATGRAHDHGLALAGRSGPQDPPHHPENDDFRQAGDLYRLLDADAKARLVDNLAGSLAEVSSPAVIEASIGHFERADADLGARLRAAVIDRRG
ncbi:MAG: catalase [Nannocystaceae bacterium]